MVGSPADRIQNSPKRFLRDRVGTEFLNGPPGLDCVDDRRVRYDYVHKVLKKEGVAPHQIVLVLVLVLVLGLVLERGRCWEDLF